MIIEAEFPGTARAAGTARRHGWVGRAYRCRRPSWARPVPETSANRNGLPLCVLAQVALLSTLLSIFGPLRALRGPVAPVVVIGPYRSGKSFLLNQLLGVPCDEGFGVGHTRKTETKGVWMWSEPTVVMSSAPGKPPTSVVYVDTEGFEATGMSDAYDDRIFALSSIVASARRYVAHASPAKMGVCISTHMAVVARHDMCA